MIIMFNFAGPVGPDEMVQAYQVIWNVLDKRFVPKAGMLNIEVRDIAFEWDEDKPFQLQIEGLIEACGLSAAQWRYCPIVFRVPREPAHAVKLLVERLNHLRGYGGYVRVVEK